MLKFLWVLLNLPPGTPSWRGEAQRSKFGKAEFDGLYESPLDRAQSILLAIREPWNECLQKVLRISTRVSCSVNLFGGHKYKVEENSI